MTAAVKVMCDFDVDQGSLSSFFLGMDCLIVELLGLIIKPFDNH